MSRKTEWLAHPDTKEFIKKLEEVSAEKANKLLSLSARTGEELAHVYQYERGGLDMIGQIQDEFIDFVEEGKEGNDGRSE